MQNNSRWDQKNKACKNRPIIPSDGAIVDAPARNEAAHDTECCDCYHDYAADACDVSSVSDWSVADVFLPSLRSWVMILEKPKTWNVRWWLTQSFFNCAVGLYA